MNPSFVELGLRPELVSVLDACSVTTPFPVQSATIPAALDGRDVAACAPTGSGKTLAFALPLLQSLERAQPKRPRALILAPTRELAGQICRDIQPLASAVGRRSLALYGGTSIAAQRRALNRGVDVVVACPGRLLDLVEQRIVDLRDVAFVVVDEADRMSDMGFLPEVRRLLSQTAADRQVLLFSATLDGDVAALVREYQHDPRRIDVGHDDGRVSHADHAFHHVEPAQRATRLTALLRNGGRTLVFCRTRRGVDRLTKVLGANGITAVALHGGHAQGRRDRALVDFTRGRVRVLVATDVAARGIHIDGIDQVVHFDVAEDAKTYLHRSGRTARAGSGGSVVSFVAPADKGRVAELRRTLGLHDASSHPPQRAPRTRSAAPRRRRPTRGAA